MVAALGIGGILLIILIVYLLFGRGGLHLDVLQTWARAQGQIAAEVRVV
jgi:Sec-independent protein translocase protein TatA